MCGICISVCCVAATCRERVGSVTAAWRRRDVAAHQSHTHTQTPYLISIQVTHTNTMLSRFYDGSFRCLETFHFAVDLADCVLWFYVRVSSWYACCGKLNWNSNTCVICAGVSVTSFQKVDIISNVKISKLVLWYLIHHQQTVRIHCWTIGLLNKKWLYHNLHVCQLGWRT